MLPSINRAQDVGDIAPPSRRSARPSGVFAVRHYRCEGRLHPGHAAISHQLLQHACKRVVRHNVHIPPGEILRIHSPGCVQDTGQALTACCGITSTLPGYITRPNGRDFHHTQPHSTLLPPALSNSSSLVSSAICTRALPARAYICTRQATLNSTR